MASEGLTRARGTGLTGLKDRIHALGGSEPVRGQREFRSAPAVQIVAHWLPGRRASSTSSTGMSSRTG